MTKFQNDIAKRILPYSYVVGETTPDDPIKLALELAYIAPLIGGVLLSGHRGTGKSTVVRAFARMMYGELPVTLPMIRRQQNQYHLPKNQLIVLCSDLRSYRRLPVPEQMLAMVLDYTSVRDLNWQSELLPQRNTLPVLSNM